MRVIHVSNEFPLNRQMRKAVRRGKLQVIRMRDELSPMGGGIPPQMRRSFRTSGLAAVCMANNGAQVGGGNNGDNNGEDGESETGFDIIHKNAREIFGGRVQFRVPIFQRDYVWGTEQWEDFWADVSGSKPQYVGGIVLRDNGENRYEIIDGQQRLTTICLFVIAALRVLHDHDQDGGFGVARDHPVCRELANAFLIDGGDLGVEIGRRNMKVVPHDPQWNPGGDGVFLSRLMTISARQGGRGSAEFQPYCERGNTSQIQMKKSVKDFFMEKLHGLNFKTPEEIRDFVFDRMGENLVFSRVVAARNEGAHAIFETLNGRGRALTPADLIKCYFMSFLDDVSEEQFRNEWDDIRKQLDGAGLKGDGNKERGKKELVGFIWAVYVCKYGAVPKQRLFREIAQKIRDRKSMLEFFGVMKKQITPYVQILAPTRKFWNREFDKVDGMRFLGVSKGRSPFIMAVHRHKNENPDAFSKSLGICYAIALRLKICGHPPGIDHNLPGIVFYRLSHKIWNTSQISEDDVLGDSDLGDLYRQEAVFKDAFGEFKLAVNNGKLSENQRGLFLHLLRMLEESIGGNVDRLNDRRPGDCIFQAYKGDKAKHRLSEYCLREKQGEPAFLTTKETAHMDRKELAEWAVEVPSWRINHFENK